MKKLLLVFFMTMAFAAVLPGAVVLVTLDTTPLTPGNFFLDFQLNSADDVAPNDNNEVVLSSFSFGGGMALGAPVLDGGATGSFGTGFTLRDTELFNAVLIEFTAGTELVFALEYSDAYTAGFPDQFSFAVLDSTLTPIVSAGVGASLLIDFDGSAEIVTFEAESDFENIEPVISEIPEPGSVLLLMSGAGALLIGARFRQRKSIR